jgi:hypothetical protein
MFIRTWLKGIYKEEMVLPFHKPKEYYLNTDQICSVRKLAGDLIVEFPHIRYIADPSFMQQLKDNDLILEHSLMDDL